MSEFAMLYSGRHFDGYLAMDGKFEEKLATNYSSGLRNRPSEPQKRS